MANNIFISDSPRFIIEPFGLIIIGFFALSIGAKNNEANIVFTNVGIFALASQRLLPIAQQIYSAWANVKSH